MGRGLIMENHFCAIAMGTACDRCGKRPAIEFQSHAPPRFRYVAVCVHCIQEALAPLGVLVGIPPEGR